MKSIPAESKILYDAALVKKGVPLTDHIHYPLIDRKQIGERL